MNYFSYAKNVFDSSISPSFLNYCFSLFYITLHVIMYYLKRVDYPLKFTLILYSFLIYFKLICRYITLYYGYVYLQVIVCLSEKSRQHIPYRNSMMTSVLRDSLGGNCRTTMIATCSVEEKNIFVC